MQGIIIKDTNVLIPNGQHQNFTETGEIIEEGTKVSGDIKKISGLRRGKPFIYTLLKTDNNKLIFLNSIKMNNATEITLGADAAVSPTLIDIPTGKKFLTKTIVISSILGLGIGYAIAKKKNYDNKKSVLFAIGGLAVGFFAGKYIEKRNAIKVTPSK